MIPLAGLFDNDFVAQLFVVDEEDTMEQVAEKLSQHAVGLRVKKQNREMEVVFKGLALPSEKKVKEVGLTVMDYVWVRYA